MEEGNNYARPVIEDVDSNEEEEVEAEEEQDNGEDDVPQLVSNPVERLLQEENPTDNQLNELPDLTWREFMDYMQPEQRSQMQRQLLSAKIRAMRNNRKPMTQATQAINRKGRPIAGARQMEIVEFDLDKKVPRNKLLEAFAQKGIVPTREEVLAKGE